MFEELKKKGYQVVALHHAEAILVHDMAAAVDELETVLLEVAIPIVELVRGGGGEGELTQRLRKALSDRFGWHKHIFEITKIIDGLEKESISHEIDHVKVFPVELLLSKLSGITKILFLTEIWKTLSACMPMVLFR